MTSNLHTTAPSPNARLSRKYGEAHPCAFTSLFDCISAQPTKPHNCLTVYLPHRQSRKPACNENDNPPNRPSVLQDLRRTPTEATNRLKTEATAHTGSIKPFALSTAHTVGPAPGNVILDATAPSQTTTATKETTKPSTHSLGQRETVTNKLPLKLVFRLMNPDGAYSVINTHRAATGNRAEASKLPNTGTTPPTGTEGTYTRIRKGVGTSLRTIPLESWKAEDRGNTMIPTTVAASRKRGNTNHWIPEAKGTIRWKAPTIRSKVRMGMKPRGTDERGTGNQSATGTRKAGKRTKGSTGPIGTTTRRLRPAIYAISAKPESRRVKRNHSIGFVQAAITATVKPFDRTSATISTSP
jgi:hypothetical protein